MNSFLARQKKVEKCLWGDYQKPRLKMIFLITSLSMENLKTLLLWLTETLRSQEALDLSLSKMPKQQIKYLPNLKTIEYLGNGQIANLQHQNKMNNRHFHPLSLQIFLLKMNNRFLPQHSKHFLLLKSMKSLSLQRFLKTIQKIAQKDQNLFMRTRWNNNFKVLIFGTLRENLVRIIRSGKQSHYFLI